MRVRMLKKQELKKKKLFHLLVKSWKSTGMVIRCAVANGDDFEPNIFLIKQSLNNFVFV